MPASKPSPSAAPDEDAITFEEAMEKVEMIVRDLEGDRVPLDKLLEGYSTGTRLLKICQARIDEAQARIEMVAAGRDGQAAAVPFEPEAAGAESQASKSSSDDDIRLF